MCKFGQKPLNINCRSFFREFGWMRMCGRLRLNGFRQTVGEQRSTFCQTKMNSRSVVTISFRRRARAASRLAGLLASRLSALFLPRLRSSWIMVFFTYILSISLQEPPLEFSKPLRLFGSGGRPSIQAIPPTEPFVDFPFIVPWATERSNATIYTEVDCLVFKSHKHGE